MQETGLGPLAQPFFFEGNQHAVLLLHGFTGSPANLRPMGEALHTAGYTVQCILLEGHGTRIEDMEKGNAGIWEAQALSAYHDLCGRYATVSVMGLSMGGALSLIVAAGQPAPACVVSMASPIRIYNPLAGLAPVLGKFVDVFGEGHQPVRGKDFLASYDLGYSGTPVKSVPQLTALMRKARECLPRITCPVLVIQSTDDPTVRPVSAEMIIDGVGSACKHLVLLRHSGHMVTLGAERGQVFAEAIEWLRKAVGA